MKKLPLFRTTDQKLPEGVDISVAQVGIKLDEKLFFSDPIPSENGVTVAILSEKVPSYLPKLDEVKAKVEADYKLSQKQKLFAERVSTLEKALKSAKDEAAFAKISREGGAKVEEFKNYVIASPSQDNASYALNAVASSELPKLAAGKMSAMQTVAGDGYIIFVSKFTPPAINTADKDFTSLKENAERSFSQISALNVVSEMISKQYSANPDGTGEIE